MAINYPTSLDTAPTFPAGTTNQPLNTPDHPTAHSNITAALVAIETYVGAIGSAVTTSITYLVNHVSAARGGTGLFVYAVGDLLYASATNALSRLAKGTEGQFLAISSGLPAWVASPVPAGSMLDFAGAAVPSGWLAADGSAVLRSTYAALFAAIGTTWGVGNGTTTFNVPDSRNRVRIGAGAATKIATIASVAANVITSTGLTNAANNEFQTGQAIVFTASVAGNLVNSTTYYVVRTGNLTFSVATSLANAQNGVVITLAGTERGTFTLTFATRTLGDTGGEDNHAMSITELVSHVHPLEDYSSTTATLPNIPHTANNATSRNSTTDAAGGNVAMNNMQLFGTYTAIIKT